MNGLVQKLRLDVGRRTIGELAQKREAAAKEIERLMREFRRLGQPLYSQDQQKLGERDAQSKTQGMGWLGTTVHCFAFPRSPRSLPSPAQPFYKRVSEGFRRPMRVGEQSIGGGQRITKRGFELEARDCPEKSAHSRAQ
jgi:hypothetical protein